MDQKKFSASIALRNVQVTDTFWKKELELVRKEVIPYQWDALNDRIEGAEKSYCMRNFKLAGEVNRKRRTLGTSYQEVTYPTNQWVTFPDPEKELEERFYGWYFQDSDFAKWIEAVAYSLTQYPDKALEELADSAIDQVVEAQLENGYLNTHYGINDPKNAFTNLRDAHELYCFGHLVEGALAYYEATGKAKLLNAVERYADYIGTVFGLEEDKKKGYPGHEIVEMALCKLYEVTKKQQYLDLATFFVEERGKRPYYFDLEHPEEKPAKEGELKFFYNQAHAPVREQKDATGHAVRGVYLYSGMADLARLTQDESLFAACETLWNDITQKKMYLTGGIGSTHLGEAFTFPFDLPNDTAYAETCASIGLVFFARRMLEMNPDSKYADVMELALYNGILSGMAQDGKSFFYVNPLEVDVEACKKDERKHHVKHQRQKWFGCACCPPNIARMISSVAAYAFTENATTLWFHLYMGANLTKVVKTQDKTTSLHIQVESNFPWSGEVLIKVRPEEAVEATMAFRIPAWCKHFPIPEELEAIATVQKGYLYLTKVWEKEEEIKLDFPMETQYLRAHTGVKEDLGRLAIKRGPVVYCAEEIDNSADLKAYFINPKQKIIRKTVNLQGEELVMLEVACKKMKTDGQQETLYQEVTGTSLDELMEEATLQLVPYYFWGNRGEGNMTVWLGMR